jgi:photosystem II stability/assembly factor-like uncharacterized protein
MLLVGWMVQLAYGVAFWILPRLDASGNRGKVWLVWVCYGALVLAGCASPAPQPTPVAVQPTGTATVAISPTPSTTGFVSPGRGELLAQEPRPTVTPRPTPTTAPTCTPRSFLRTFHFLDHETGWLVFGQTVYATDDSGQTWQQRGILPVPWARDMQMASAQTGWVTTTDGAFATIDGGLSWKPIATTPTPIQPEVPQPETIVVRSVRLSTYAFCPEEDPTVGPYGHGGAQYAGPFFALDNQTAWAFCTSDSQTYYIWRTLFRTDDGGQTWKQIAEDPPFGRYRGTQITFVDEQHGWINTPRAIYASTDGGYTWELFYGDPAGQDWVGPLQFLTRQVGFLAVDGNYQDGGKLLRTTDGGQSWEQIYP